MNKRVWDEVGMFVTEQPAPEIIGRCQHCGVAQYNNPDADPALDAMAHLCWKCVRPWRAEPATFWSPQDRKYITRSEHAVKYPAQHARHEQEFGSWLEDNFGKEA